MPRVHTVNAPPTALPPALSRTSIDSDAAELAVLRLLQDDPSLSQRELSKALGLSLGKTHYLLRALLEIGALKVSNFRRSDNKVAYMYLLTPAGMRKRLDLTRAFLARKESEYLALQRTIHQLRSELPPGRD
jgi:EPS-associated MarR family transcriptional regulator